MRSTQVLSNQEYLPTLQEKNRGAWRISTATSMDNSDIRNNDEQETNSQRLAARAQELQQAIAAGRRPRGSEAGSYPSYNTNQPVSFGSNQDQQNMSAAAGPVYRADYNARAAHGSQQQSVAQHSAYQYKNQGTQQQPQQGYQQQLPNQLPAYQFGAQQGFPQQAPAQQGQPYQQAAYGQNQTAPQQQYPTMQTPYIQEAPARPSLERPIVKLSLNLIDTYKRINEAYYENQRQRAEEEPPRRDETRQEPRGQGVHNHGWDDENYDYILINGEMIQGRYRIQERIGRGSFGQVVRAFDTETQKDVAIKIIKSRRPFLLQARTEIELLVHLRQQDTDDQNNIVRLFSHFMYRNHQCLVFEMLSLNLYELLRNTQFDGVSLNLIRKFAKQILKALQFLGQSDVDVIHCDLKPENILLRHPKRSGVKVIDFGSSCRSNNQMYSYIQSRFYRSPEVLLGLPYSVAIDMWSLGCILVEMHTGEPLFSGSDQVDQMQKIVKILGMVPDEIINRMRDQQRNQFFERDPKGQWALRRSEGQTEPIVPSTNPRESLKEVLRDSSDSPANYDVFVELIYRMLSYKPVDRITPTQALGHQYVVAGQ